MTPWFFNFFLDSFEILNDVSQYCSPLISSPLTTAMPPHKRKQIKVSKKVNKSKSKTKTKQKLQQQQKTLCFFFLFLQHLWVAMEASVCHIIYLFVPSVLLTNVYCSESLVWFKISGISCGCHQSWRTCGYLSTGPVPSLAPEGPRWDRNKGESIQGPAVGLDGSPAGQSGPLWLPTLGEGVGSAPLLIRACLRGHVWCILSS